MKQITKFAWGEFPEALILPSVKRRLIWQHLCIAARVEAKCVEIGHSSLKVICPG